MIGMHRCKIKIVLGQNNTVQRKFWKENVMGTI